MPDRSNTPDGKIPGRVWVPAFVLIASFSLTIFATYYAARTVRLRERQEFQSATYQARSAVEAGIASYGALLRGGAAFVDAYPEMTREAFKDYVERLRLPLNYPGIQGFGYTARIHPEDLTNIIAKAHSEGITNFNVWPILKGEDIHAILYIEPLDRRNYAALGYNMFSEPIRREAMKAACDSGVPTGSARVTLVQEIEGPVQPGFLIYKPVYDGGGVPDTVASRRATLKGFVYTPFRAKDLFRNVLPSDLLKVLRIQIYDGATPRKQALLYSSWGYENKNPLFLEPLSMTSHVSMAQRLWTMRFEWRGPPTAGWYLVPLVFVVGTVVTLLLSWLTIAEGRAKARTEEANERLVASEQSLREARARLEQHTRQLEVRVAERTLMLQESVKDLESVLYHVAHDLRAPVRAMGSFASILREDYRTCLDERAISYLSRISEAASRMDRLVYDLLAYGRLAQLPVKNESLSLEDCISTILSRRADEIKSLNAEIIVTGPFPKVQADPGLASEALSRMLDNALKFVPPERKPRIHIWFENNKTGRLWIEDNGIGIKPEYHERIFRVFEKLHAGGTYSGTGIGLAIARKAIQRLGGRIGLESAPGEGSRFWVEFPQS